jgi:phage tail sheath protein FI
MCTATLSIQKANVKDITETVRLWLSKSIRSGNLALALLLDVPGGDDKVEICSKIVRGGVQ